jgi:hypothetical protein
MEALVCLDDLLIETLESYVIVAALLRVNGRSDRIRVRQLELRSHSDGSRTLRERHVHLDRLDAEAHEHRVDGLGPAGPAAASAPINTSV